MSVINTTAHQRNKTVWAYIAIAGLLWAGMETALKLVSGQFHPIQLTFSRVFVGGLILFPGAIRSLRQRNERLDSHALGALFVLSFVGISFSMSVSQLAILRIPAAVVGALTSTNPIFSVVFSFLLLHETIHKHHFVSIIFALVGILLIVRPWSVRLDPWGLALALLAPFSFSLYSVYGKKMTKRYGGVVVTSICFLMGAVEMMSGAVLSHIPAVAHVLSAMGLEVFANIPFFTGYSLAALPAVLYIFVGATGIGFACYFLAIEKGSVQQASVVFFIKPMLAPIIAWILLRETIHANEFAGILCVIFAALALACTDLYHSLCKI